MIRDDIKTALVDAMKGGGQGRRRATIRLIPVAIKNSRHRASNRDPAPADDDLMVSEGLAEDDQGSAASPLKLISQGQPRPSWPMPMKAENLPSIERFLPQADERRGSERAIQRSSPRPARAR
jgi:hypothetical protein